VFILSEQTSSYTQKLCSSNMALRVISTKISEEQYSKISQVCNQTGCTLSAFLKQCVMELIDKESSLKINSSQETINAPEFSLNNDIPVQEQKISPKIRYQYF
jgi:hypothetical protein